MITDRMVEAALNKMLDKLYEFGGVRVAGWPAMQNDAMRAALTAADAAAWEGMETAPWDTDILLGWWSERTGGWEMDSGWAGRRNSCPPESRASNGWQHGNATHWRPLPAPPVQS